MRLFIAIQLDDAMKDALASVQRDMIRRGVRGRFTPRENLHLTLAFIGEYADPDGVLEVIDRLPFRPFTLALRGLGAFCDLWWAGLEGSEPLAACVRALRRDLAGAGIPFDAKRFSPHITLVRRAAIEGGTMPAIALPEARMTADHIALMRSDRGKRGMIYTELT